MLRAITLLKLVAASAIGGVVVLCQDVAAKATEGVGDLADDVAQIVKSDESPVLKIGILALLPVGGALLAVEKAVATAEKFGKRILRGVASQAKCLDGEADDTQ